MTLVRLVFGGSARAREQAIATNLDPIGVNIALIEGLPDGTDALDTEALEPRLQVVRMAPGCPCCIGNLTLRVTLNRLLRQSPACLFLSLANAAHKERVKIFLQETQYQHHLRLDSELDCN